MKARIRLKLIINDEQTRIWKEAVMESGVATLFETRMNNHNGYPLTEIMNLKNKQNLFISLYLAHKLYNNNNNNKESHYRMPVMCQLTQTFLHCTSLATAMSSTLLIRNS
jgi:hypothetical protein